MPENIPTLLRKYQPRWTAARLLSVVVTFVRRIINGGAVVYPLAYEYYGLVTIVNDDQGARELGIVDGLTPFIWTTPFKKRLLVIVDDRLQEVEIHQAEHHLDPAQRELLRAELSWDDDLVHSLQQQAAQDFEQSVNSKLNGMNRAAE